MKKTSLLILLVLVLSHLLHAAEKLPKVYLNRVGIVVDDVTFNGIVKSAFMTKKFARVDAGLPKFIPPTDTSHVLYVVGKNTQVEIYSVNNPYGLKEGQVGIGFAVEQINGAKQLFDSLSKNKDAQLFFATDSANINGIKVAEKQVLSLRDPGENINLTYGVTEYLPDVMQALFKQNFKSKPVKRSDFLKKRYNTDKLFSDIMEISLQLSKTETTAFIEALKKLDFNVSEKNNTYIAKGNDIVFRVKVSEEVMPKLQLKFKMNAPKDGNYNLNNSKLEFDGTYGTWNFY